MVKVRTFISIINMLFSIPRLSMKAKSELTEAIKIWSILIILALKPKCLPFTIINFHTINCVKHFVSINFIKMVFFVLFFHWLTYEIVKVEYGSLSFQDKFKN